MTGRASSGRLSAAFAAALLLPVHALSAQGLALAQDLPLRTDDPSSATFECPAWAPATVPTQEALRAADEIASDANDALVLGDVERARELLARSLELNEGSAELRYRYARVLESLGAHKESILELCRVLAVRSESDEPTDAEARLDSLAALDRDALPPEALAAFAEGIETARAGRLDDAKDAFETAAEAAPDWPAASYNLGVVLAMLGEHEGGAERLRRYLALTPDADDAIPVSHAVGMWEASASTRRTDARTTLALGLVLPGMGQLYSGRSRIGAAVLGAAAGTLATGLLVRQTTVRCLSAASPGACPSDQVVSRQTRRPHMGLSLAVAGIITAAAAIEAYIRTRAPGPDEPSVVNVQDDGSDLTEGAASALGPQGTDVVVFRLRVP